MERNSRNEMKEEQERAFQEAQLRDQEREVMIKEQEQEMKMQEEIAVFNMTGIMPGIMSLSQGLNYRS